MSTRITMPDQTPSPETPPGFMMLPPGLVPQGADYQSMVLYHLYQQAVEQARQAMLLTRRLPDLFANMN